MTDTSVGIKGSNERARKDGNSARKESKESLKRLAKTAVLFSFGVMFILVVYDFLSPSKGKDDAEITKEIQTSTEPQVTKFTITTPKQGCSEWINLLPNQNIYWQGDDPVDKRFEEYYADEYGEVSIYDGTPLTKMKAVKFCSLTGKNEDVHVSIEKKEQYP